jgi:hypothetical protein
MDRTYEDGARAKEDAGREEPRGFEASGGVPEVAPEGERLTHSSHACDLPL